MPNSGIDECSFAITASSPPSLLPLPSLPLSSLSPPSLIPPSLSLSLPPFLTMQSHLSLIPCPFSLLPLQIKMQYLVKVQFNFK